jgi:hypothetical protein
MLPGPLASPVKQRPHWNYTMRSPWPALLIVGASLAIITDAPLKLNTVGSHWRHFQALRDTGRTTEALAEFTAMADCGSRFEVVDPCVRKIGGLALSFGVRRRPER